MRAGDHSVQIRVCRNVEGLLLCKLVAGHRGGSVPAQHKIPDSVAKEQ